jgi:hypothetical protein
MDLTPKYPILFLRTNDMNKTRYFYESILNFPIALEQNGCIIYQIGIYGYWGFCQTDEPIVKPEQICLTLVVDSREQVDTWHKHLEESEVEVKMNPQYTSQYKIYNGFYIDPTGYTLEIQVFDKDGEPKGHDNFK